MSIEVGTVEWRGILIDTRTAHERFLGKNTNVNKKFSKPILQQITDKSLNGKFFSLPMFNLYREGNTFMRFTAQLAKQDSTVSILLMLRNNKATKRTYGGMKCRIDKRNITTFRPVTCYDEGKVLTWRPSPVPNVTSCKNRYFNVYLHHVTEEIQRFMELLLSHCFPRVKLREKLHNEMKLFAIQITNISARFCIPNDCCILYSNQKFRSNWLSCFGKSCFRTKEP